MVDFQLLFNIAFGVLGTLSGIVIKMLWDALASLRRHDERLAAKVNAIEVLVAGQYIHKDEFTRFSIGMLKKLDRISSQLAYKEDRRSPRPPD